MNALTGAAIPRALVSLGSRKVLTDFQGRFEFREFAEAQAFVSVVKPGYSQSAEPGEMYVERKVPDLSAPVEVKLYPDGVITGIVAGHDGVPLSQIPVGLRRASYDSSGLRWLNAGLSVTNSRGEYRFGVPAGRYRLAVSYSSRRADTPDAVLPLRFPVEISTDTSASWISLLPGEEKPVDLRPRTAPVHPVAIRIDPGGSRQNLRLSAVTGSGDAFNLNYTPGAVQGEFRVDLPTGSYMVNVQSDTREESLVGAGRVTVTDGEAASLTLHLAPATSLPVEVAADPAVASQKQLGDPVAVPNVGQLGLSLRDLSGGGDPAYSDIPVQPRPDRTFQFRVAPGRYRLAGGSGGAWYVETATYGGITNLLTSDLAIAAGSAGEPIRIVAGSGRGNLRGQVTLPASVPTAWVYLFPRQPALAAPNPQPTGSDGSFVASVPPGTYSVAAFAHRIQEDLKNPETVERLTAGAKTVEVTAGTNSMVNLDLSQTKAGPE